MRQQSLEAGLRVGATVAAISVLLIMVWAPRAADAHAGLMNTDPADAGHGATNGAYVFSIGGPGGHPQGLALDLIDGDDRSWRLGAVLGRWVAYGGALLAVGGLAFLFLVHDGREPEAAMLRRVVAWGAVAGALGTLVGVPLQAAVLTGLGVRAIADTAVFAQVLGSGFGLSALVRLAGLAVVLGAVSSASRRWQATAAGLGSVLAIGSMLLTGHTVTSDPRWLVLLATFAHGLAAAVWFGGLVLLGATLRRRRLDEDATGGARLVARFSALAMTSVGVLVAAGVALSWAEVRALRALTTTTYGWTLIAKIVLVLLILGIAAYNHQRLVPAVRRRAGDAEAAWQRLRSTVRVETYGILAVTAVTAVLVNLVPARTEAGIGQPVAEYAELGPEHQVQLVIDPAEAGRNEIHLYLLETSGRPADIAEEVLIRLRLPDQEIAAIEREPTRAGPGHYVHVGEELSMPGRWEVETVVDVDDFTRLTATIEADIGGRAR